MQTDVVRLALAALVTEILLGFSVGSALFEGRLPGALALVAAVVGLAAGVSVSLEKRRRPQRAAHLVLIGAALSVASLRAELRMGTPSGASLAPAGLLGGAALLDMLRERATRMKEPLRLSPMAVLAVLSGGAMAAVLEATSIAQRSATTLALAVASSALTLSATFLGGPNRPIARPGDAGVFLGVGVSALLLLP